MDLTSQNQSQTNRRYPILLKGVWVASFLMGILVIIVSLNSFGTVKQPASTIIPASLIFASIFIAVRLLMVVAQPGETFQARLLIFTNLFSSVSLAILSDGWFTAIIPLLIAGLVEFASWFCENEICLASSLSTTEVVGDSTEPVDSTVANEFQRSQRVSDEDSCSDRIEFEDLEEEGLEESGEIHFESNCIQKISRFDTEEVEIISGQARASFQKGERTQVVHIGFCPPFSVNPTAEIFQADGENVILKPTAVERFGMRFEVKRTRALSDEDVVVDFLVQGVRENAIGSPTVC